MAIYWGLWNSVFQADFHPICECMFGLSFLTNLNIYKDYFKGYKRLHTVAQEHNSTSVKKCVTRNLVCPSSSFSWRSYCVCTPYGFVTKQLHNLHRVMNRRTLQSTFFSSWWLSRVLGSVQLVSHVLRAMHWNERLSLQNKFNWVLG